MNSPKMTKAEFAAFYEAMQSVATDSIEASSHSNAVEQATYALRQVLENLGISQEYSANTDSIVEKYKRLLAVVELSRASGNRDVFGSIYRQRWIEQKSNQRAAVASSRKTVRLYHFTRVPYIRSIKAHGLYQGDVPVRMNEVDTRCPSADCFNNAVWLTSDPNPQRQNWCVNGMSDKMKVRISVDIDDSDANLWRWRDLANHLCVEKTWYQKLNGIGGGFADKWWVYVNEPIGNEQFVDVEYMP